MLWTKYGREQCTKEWRKIFFISLKLNGVCKSCDDHSGLAGFSQPYVVRDQHASACVFVWFRIKDIPEYSMRTSQLVPMGDEGGHIFIILSCVVVEKVGRVGIPRT